jgi:hypothetical protein
MQACTFTRGPCLDQKDCENTCGVHVAAASVQNAAADRAFGGNYWEMCPLLAGLVAQAGTALSDGKRKLLGSEVCPMFRHLHIHACLCCAAIASLHG